MIAVSSSTGSLLCCHTQPDVVLIEDVISNLPILEDMKVFLTQEKFTDDLRDIYRIRHCGAHPLPWHRTLLLVNQLRKRILGIGCEGYLIKLAEMKKFIDGSKCNE